MKTSNIIKAAIYVAAGIAIIILHKTLIAYAGYIVGGVVCGYALEEFIRCTVEKRLFKEDGSLFEDTAQLVIGVLLILVSGDIIKVCLVWGVWSILRESKEMAGAIKNIVKRRSGIINVAESVVVMVLSAIMVLNPSEHYATFHMVLLGSELILEIVFEAVEYVYETREERARELKTAGDRLETAFQEEVAAAKDETDER